LVKLIADKLKSTLLARDLLDVSRQTINGHHLEQMIKLLLHHGDLDRKFVAALMEQLLSVCRSQKSDAFYAFAGPVTSIIASLLSSYLYEVWHEVSKVITSADSLVRFYAERLFDPPHEHHLARGLLHGLPPEVYLDWVRKAPDARAEVVMKWLPITTVRSDGTSTWSPDLEAYISEFGDRVCWLGLQGGCIHGRGGAPWPRILSRFCRFWKCGHGVIRGLRCGAGRRGKSNTSVLRLKPAARKMRSAAWASINFSLGGRSPKNHPGTGQHIQGEPDILAAVGATRTFPYPIAMGWQADLEEAVLNDLDL
jgi:hypothetical protein